MESCTQSHRQPDPGGRQDSDLSHQVCLGAPASEAQPRKTWEGSQRARPGQNICFFKTTRVLQSLKAECERYGKYYTIVAEMATVPSVLCAASSSHRHVGTDRADPEVATEKEG